MKTFDGIKEEAVNIIANERRGLKYIPKIILPYKEVLGNDYNVVLEELASADAGFRGLMSLINLLYEKAILDPVGLYSKAYFDDKLSSLETEIDLAFIMGDVDKFHDYNESYGHLQGDVALKNIAQRFRESIEERLVRDEESLVARFGGEEFCAFIRNYQRGNQILYQLTKGIRMDVEQLEIPKLPEIDPPDEGYKYRTMTFAAGLRKKDEPIRTLMQKINSLLIKKNKKGRNKVYLRK